MTTALIFLWLSANTGALAVLLAKWRHENRTHKAAKRQS